MTGRTIRSKTTIADTGFPGSPKMGVLPARPAIVGLPGLIDMPCTRTPGPPSSASTRAVMSRLPTGASRREYQQVSTGHGVARGPPLGLEFVREDPQENRRATGALRQGRHRVRG